MFTTSESAKIRMACQEYIAAGGLPEVQLFTNKREYVKTVYEKVLLGDIIERENVKNKFALRLMIKKIAETVMSEISFNTLAGNVKASGTKTSTDSMIEYSSYAQNAYLVFRTSNYVSNSGRNCNYNNDAENVRVHAGEWRKSVPARRSNP